MNDSVSRFKDQLGQVALDKIPAFSALNAAARETVIKKLELVTLKRGQLICENYVCDESVYFVLSGQVKQSVLTLSGKEVIFDTLKQGDSFGLLAVITGTDTKASYVAKTDCELCVIDSDNFKLLMERFQTVASAVTLELAHSILKLTARMYEFRAMDAGQRTRAELLRHAVPDQGAFSACINILPTHEEIASTVFSHREAITKELSKLKKLGLINFQNGQMLIPDTRMIEEMIPDQALTGN